MTTNQTIDGVRRSTLDRALNGCGLEKTEALKELRALLDAPESTPCAKSQVEPAAQPQGQPVLIIRIKVIGDEFSAVALPAFFDQATSLRDGEHDLYAKRPQGEPVALPELKDGNGPSLSNHRSFNQGWNAYAEAVRKLGPLYAEQPAPVAVVITCCGSCPAGCPIGVKA